MRSMQEKLTVSMKSSAEIRILNADKVEHGKGYEISMRQSISSVCYVLNVELQFRWRRSITSYR